MARQIIIEAYDSSWKRCFDHEKVLLTRIFNNHIVDIQHFGSTSIEGMWAKPIIDILVVIDDIQDVDKFNGKMELNGYTPKGENGISGRRYFFKHLSGDSSKHTHHVHIYQKGQPNIDDELMFRDYLRINKEAVSKYERVKKRAAVEYHDSPDDYTEAKTQCVLKIMQEAKAFYSNQNS